MRPVVVRLTAVSKAALNESCLIFALCETAWFTGSKLMGAADLSVSDADLDLLDAYLLSDQSPPECMLLSDLDGFLTGVAIGPEVVMPSEWLPHVWGGQEPVFDDPVQASANLGTILGRYIRQFLHHDPVGISYLFGCGGQASGAVVDPVGDIGPYLRASEET